MIEHTENTPNHKIVLTDLHPDQLTDFECVNCDFVCSDKNEAINHMQEFKHELWAKRK